MYICDKFCVSEIEVNDIIESLEENDELTVDILLMVHYAYHKDDEDFDGGLNLFDLLNEKLKKEFEIHWDVVAIKDIIRSSTTPQYDYYYLLNELLTPQMIRAYGI